MSFPSGWSWSDDWRENLIFFYNSSIELNCWEQRREKRKDFWELYSEFSGVFHVLSLSQGFPKRRTHSYRLTLLFWERISSSKTRTMNVLIFIFIRKSADWKSLNRNSQKHHAILLFLRRERTLTNTKHKNYNFLLKYQHKTPKTSHSHRIHWVMRNDHKSTSHWTGLLQPEAWWRWNSSLRN